MNPYGIPPELLAQYQADPMAAPVQAIPGLDPALAQQMAGGGMPVDQAMPVAPMNFGDPNVRPQDPWALSNQDLLAQNLTMTPASNGGGGFPFGQSSQMKPMSLADVPVDMPLQLPGVPPTKPAAVVPPQQPPMGPPNVMKGDVPKPPPGVPDGTLSNMGRETFDWTSQPKPVPQGMSQAQINAAMQIPASMTDAQRLASTRANEARGFKEAMDANQYEAGKQAIDQAAESKLAILQYQSLNEAAAVKAKAEIDASAVRQVEALGTAPPVDRGMQLIGMAAVALSGLADSVAASGGARTNYAEKAAATINQYIERDKQQWLQERDRKIKNVESKHGILIQKGLSEVEARSALFESAGNAVRTQLQAKVENANSDTEYAKSVAALRSWDETKANQHLNELEAKKAANLQAMMRGVGGGAGKPGKPMSPDDIEKYFVDPKSWQEVTDPQTGELLLYPKDMAKERQDMFASGANAEHLRGEVEGLLKGTDTLDKYSGWIGKDENRTKLESLMASSVMNDRQMFSGAGALDKGLGKQLQTRNGMDNIMKNPRVVMDILRRVGEVQRLNARAGAHRGQAVTNQMPLPAGAAATYTDASGKKVNLKSIPKRGVMDLGELDATQGQNVPNSGDLKVPGK